MPHDRDPAAIQAEIKSLLQLIRDERALVLAQFDDLTALVLSADRADAMADGAARDRHCARLQDLSYDVLGDCEPVEMLLALLGYEEPSDEPV